MSNYPRLSVGAVLATAALVLSVQPAASVTLRLSNLGDVVLVDDQGLNDTNRALDVVSFNGTVGAFTARATAQARMPGAPARPTLDLTTTGVMNSTTSLEIPLLVQASHQGFSSSEDSFGSTTPVNMSAGGRSNGILLRAESFVDPMDRLFETGTEATAIGRLILPLSGLGDEFESVSDSAQNNVIFDFTQPFSMTTVARIQHDDELDEGSLTIRTQVVPVPAALPLLASALGCLAWLGISRRRRAYVM